MRCNGSAFKGEHYISSVLASDFSPTPNKVSSILGEGSENKTSQRRRWVFRSLVQHTGNYSCTLILVKGSVV